MANTLLKDFRAQYPQYKDTSDEDLASAIHQQFYPEMAEPVFRQQLGLGKATQDAPHASAFDSFISGFEDVAGGAAGAAVKGAVGVADAARSMATGTGADVAGGLMGAATLATNAAGLTHDDPVAMIRSWQAKAYQPETEVGKEITGTLGKVDEKTVGKLETYAGETAFEATGSPFVATVAELMPDVLMTISGAEVPAAMKNFAMKGAAKISRDAVLNQTKTAAMRTARQNGLKVSPSEYGGPIGRGIAGVSNKAEIERDVSVDNNGRVVDLFKANFHLPEDKPINRATFREVRAQLHQPYEEGRKLGRMPIDAPYMGDIFNAGAKFDQLTQDFAEPELVELEKKIAETRGTYMQPSWDANSAINAMQYLRENSSDLLRSAKATDRKLGLVQREISDAIEDRLYRHAASPQINKPDLAARFQNARKQSAQLHVWEDNADLDKGFFSSRGIVATRDMMAGKVDPFTDELKIVADAAGAFPYSFQEAKIRTTPISVFERYMIIGGALGAASGAILGGAAGGGEGALIGAGIAGSGIAGRSAMTSDWWQRSMMKPKTGGPGMLRNAAMQAGPTAEAAGAVAGAESGNE